MLGFAEPDPNSKIYCVFSPAKAGLRSDQRAPSSAPFKGNAVLKYGPTEILPPIGANWKTLRVSAVPVAKPAALTGAESRGSRPSKKFAGERQTVCWRGVDFELLVPREIGVWAGRPLAALPGPYVCDRLEAAERRWPGPTLRDDANPYRHRAALSRRPSTATATSTLPGSHLRTVRSERAARRVGSGHSSSDVSLAALGRTRRFDSGRCEVRKPPVGWGFCSRCNIHSL